MRRKFLNLSGITAIERHQAISAASDAITAGGGWIIDHTLFSNMMATIRFSLPPDGQGILQKQIEAADIHLDADSSAALNQISPSTQDEILGALNLTFVHHEPDLRMEIPAVPG